MIKNPLISEQRKKYWANKTVVEKRLIFTKLGQQRQAKLSPKQKRSLSLKGVRAKVKKQNILLDLIGSKTLYER